MRTHTFTPITPMPTAVLLCRSSRCLQNFLIKTHSNNTISNIILCGEYLLINPNKYSIKTKQSLLYSDIIKDSFGNIVFNLENVSIFHILAHKNEHCDEINNEIVNNLPR